jgi:4-aminobutyrate aminotransferase-like enzyme
VCLTVALASTFAGSAVACAAANAVLDIYEAERIVENARVRGEQLLAGLLDLKRRHPLVGDVQGKGLYAAIEFVRDRNRFTLLPTLVITAEQVDRALAIFDTVIGRAEQQSGIGRA